MAGARTARDAAWGRASDALDDYPVGLDRHLDLAMPGPVLGVHRIVLHGRIEPQAVALLLAVVEAGLQRGAWALPAATATSPSPATGFRILPRLLFLFGLFLLDLFVFDLFVFGLFLLGLLHRGLDLCLDLVAKLHLATVLPGGQFMAATELPQLGRGDIELVSDPGVGAALPHPRADLVQL